MIRLTRHLRGITALTGAGALALSLTSCAGGSDDSSADNGGIRIVASTSTWGDLAQQVVDDAEEESGTDLDITVDTILSGTDDDPHAYEATARDIATIRDADVVVGNGAGYDNWLTDNAGDDSEVITAAPLAEAHDHSHEDGEDGEEGEEEAHDHAEDDASDESDGHDHGDSLLAGEENPHVWLDMDVVTGFADSLAAHLNTLDESIPAEATGVTEMAEGFTERIQALPHAHVILTESVAAKLLDGSEVHDVTPEGFARSVLNEGEPSVADLSSTRDLVTGGEADALITNRQSESQSSERLSDAAEDADVPVVNVNETPDTDQDYEGYVDTLISDLEEALA
ncbi:MAG TPA: zinc ABC transporter substrate-binding protein [Candidatus Corynebacterium avicola]|uniref:Zinc ABC transporter substrate-binding protein n=1 Tax=Candidatus Corynebacterium avicola TaxID=2838527 RepID=A0A9D1RNH6_9CORY|nr:zinc ABC transporter substrate-binding protein [Candidatus Corynebacterium avicola]